MPKKLLNTWKKHAFQNYQGKFISELGTKWEERGRKKERGVKGERWQRGKKETGKEGGKEETRGEEFSSFYSVFHGDAEASNVKKTQGRETSAGISSSFLQFINTTSRCDCNKSTETHFKSNVHFTLKVTNTLSIWTCALNRPWVLTLYLFSQHPEEVDHPPRCSNMPRITGDRGHICLNTQGDWVPLGSKDRGFPAQPAAWVHSVVIFYPKQTFGSGPTPIPTTSRGGPSPRCSNTPITGTQDHRNTGSQEYRCTNRYRITGEQDSRGSSTLRRLDTPKSTGALTYSRSQLRSQFLPQHPA